MNSPRGVSVMVSVVLILLVLLLAGSALLVLYGRSATRGSEGRLLSSLQAEFLDLQSSLWTMGVGEEVQANLRLSAEEPFLSAWKGRAGTLRLVPPGGLYMRTITITNPKNYPLYDFPVRVQLTSATFDFGKVKRDGGDIRFYRGEVPLRYYVESWDYPNSAVIWVNVPYLPASGTENIEMYYGIGSWESTSDPSALWLIMEDMRSPPAGTLKGSAEYVRTRGYVRLTPARNNLNGQLEYQLNPGEGFLARFELWAGLRTAAATTSEGADATWLYAYCTSTPTVEDGNAGGYHFVFDEYDDWIQIYWAGASAATAVTRTDIDNLSWHSIEIRHWRKGAVENDNTEIYYDGVRVLVDEDPLRPKTGLLFGWAARTGGANNEHRIRNLYVRKYTFPEPSATVGNETLAPWKPFLGPGLGSLEVGVRGWFTPATTFILEGGAVLVEDAGGCRMLSPPPLIQVSGENTLTVTYCLLKVPERSTVSLGTKKVILRCVNAGYREAPSGGPNRENVVVDLGMVEAGHREAWKKYLVAENARLNSLGLNAYIDNLNPLRLAILGKVTAPGTKDLYYYEKVVEVEVEVL